MGHTLVIRQELWQKLRAHLLADWSEHAAFVLVNPAGPRLLAHDLVLISDDTLEGGGADGLSIKLPILLNVLNTANRRNLALVEAHSHPFSSGSVDFSIIDQEGQEEMVAYLADVSPGQPYGALVFGQRALRGRLWQAAPEGASLDKVLVTGDVLEQWPGNGKPLHATARVRGQRDDGLYGRQVLAIGQDGQALIAQTKVAIVGLGGTGSIVAQELAHLGVREFVLVDDDTVEVSNLNRLVGTTRKDVGGTKVGVAKRQIRRINPMARVRALQGNIRDATDNEAVLGADVLFGCVDTDAGRLVLNELAVAYLIPFIDCGVGISVSEGAITEAGGRTILWVPGRPCLLCCKEINPQVAAEELESAEQREFRRLHGYVTGADVPEPAVVSLNGTVASLAVTEFLALVTGIRPSQHYTYYDMLEQRVGPRIVKRLNTCPVCSLEGIGRQANLERYAHRDLPSDLPRL